MHGKYHIAALIEAGEGERLDYKQRIPGAQKIAKILCAFANTKGGLLLVGIKDNGQPCRIHPEEEQHLLETAAGHYCTPEVHIEFATLPYLGFDILVASISRSEEKPHYAKGEDGKWWAYLRVHDQCLLASKVMLEVMKNGSPRASGSTLTFGPAEKIVLQYLNHHPRITMKEFCKIANIGRWRAQKILVALVRMGIIKVISTEKTDYYAL